MKNAIRHSLPHRGVSRIVTRGRQLPTASDQTSARPRKGGGRGRSRSTQLPDEVLPHACVCVGVVERPVVVRDLRVDRPDGDHAVLQHVACDLILVVRDEHRVDRHQPDLSPEGERVQHRRLTESDHRDVDRGPRLPQGGLLEVPHDECGEASLLGREGVRDDLRRAAELGDGMKVAVPRPDARRVHREPGAGDGAHEVGEAREARRIDVGVGEALVPDARRLGRAVLGLGSGVRHRGSLRSRGRRPFPGAAGCGTVVLREARRYPPAPRRVHRGTRLTGKSASKIATTWVARLIGARCRGSRTRGGGSARLTHRAMPRMIAFSDSTLGVASTVPALFGPDAV
jgi:hypothetical protein